MEQLKQEITELSEKLTNLKTLIEVFGRDRFLFFDSRYTTESRKFYKFVKYFFEKNSIIFNNNIYTDIIDYYELIDDEEYVYGVKLI